MLESLISSIPNIAEKLHTISVYSLAFTILICLYYAIRSKYSINIKKITAFEFTKSLKFLFIVFLIIQAFIFGLIMKIDQETKAIPNKKFIIIEIDDFWNLNDGNFERYGYSIENYESVIRLIEQHNYTATLGVSPYVFIEEKANINALRDDSTMVDYLKQKKAKGHEIAMHGYAHCRNIEYCPDFEENYLNILQGKKELDKLFGQKTTTYLPPGNFWDDQQYENVKRNGFKIIANAKATKSYWDGNVLMTQRSYDIVQTWDWYGNRFEHASLDNLTSAYETSDYFILQLHANTFNTHEKLSELNQFLDYLNSKNATVVTYSSAYDIMRRDS